MTVGPTVEADMEKDINESTMMSISKMKATPLMDGEKEAEHVDMDRTMIKSVHLCQWWWGDALGGHDAALGDVARHGFHVSTANTKISLTLTNDTWNPQT